MSEVAFTGDAGCSREIQAAQEEHARLETGKLADVEASPRSTQEDGGGRIAVPEARSATESGDSLALLERRLAEASRESDRELQQLQKALERCKAVHRGHFTFYFPIVTSILLSLLLTAILWLLRR